MRHIVNYDDFWHAKVEHILASSASKRLVLTVCLFNNALNYEVIKNGIVDYETSILERAIEHYNELE